MDSITHIGLDVHKDAIVVAALRPGSMSPEEKVIPNPSEVIRRLVSRRGDPSLLRSAMKLAQPGMTPTGFWSRWG